MEEKVQGSKSRIALIIGVIAIVAVIAVIVVCVLLLRTSYKSQINSFVAAMSDEEKMDKFVEKKVNLRALYAFEQIQKDKNLDYNDEKAVQKAFKKEYKNAKKADYEDSYYVDGVKSLYKMMTHLTSASDDVEIKVKEIEKLETCDEWKMFQKANFTIDVKARGNSQEMKLYGLFYKNKLVLFGAESDESSVMMQ